MSKGKKIELHLVNGMPTGIISAKLMNWDSYCYKIPRNEINEKTLKNMKMVY